MLSQDEKYQQLRQQYDELIGWAKDNVATLARFQDFERDMLACENISALMETLLLKSYQRFDLSDCRLIWFDDQQTFRPLLSESDRKQYGHRLVFSGMSFDVEGLFKNKQTPILRALSPSEKLRWFPGKTNVATAAFIPLICGGKLVGSLNFASPKIDRFTEDKGVDFITHMGFIVAICLQNQIAQEQIRLLGLLDNLTKVKNRRSFDQDIKTEVARAKRNKQPLSCLFLDADFFKNINDTHGHQAGDETLRCMAKWAQAQLRETDHIARYGGEEFAILLPNCDERLAFEIADRIRRFTEEQVVNFEGVGIQFTLSIGVSTFHAKSHQHIDSDRAIKTLLGQADAGVYDAKETGRNKVCYREFGEALEASVI